MSDKPGVNMSSAEFREFCHQMSEQISGRAFISNDDDKYERVCYVSNPFDTCDEPDYMDLRNETF